MCCVSSIICNSILVLYNVKSLLITDFSLVEKTLRISLTHKITNVPSSKNTFRKTQFLLKNLIVYSIAISFECKKENMQIPPVNFLKFGTSHWCLFLLRITHYTGKSVPPAE